MGTPKHIVVTVKMVFRGLTFGLTFISDENTVNYPGNALVFHPRCGASVSLFNGYRSAHRPRYGHYIVACVTLKSFFVIFHCNECFTSKSLGKNAFQHFKQSCRNIIYVLSESLKKIKSIHYCLLPSEPMKNLTMLLF